MQPVSDAREFDTMQCILSVCALKPMMSHLNLPYMHIWLLS